MFKKKWMYLIIIFLIFFNLGNIFDRTDKPRKVDIIVYLGGGSVERIEKTLELYNKGYSTTNKVIFTGYRLYRSSKKNYTLHNKKEFFINHGILINNIIHANKNTGNTVREVRFVKKYMLEQHLHSVMFVTDPPHSLRVKMLAEEIADFSGNNLEYFVIGTDVQWWDKSTYYLQKNALLFVASEMIKLPYNYITYGILEKYGWLEFVKEHFQGVFHKLKIAINNLINKQWE